MRGHRNYKDSRAVSADEARFLARKLRHAIGQIADDAVLLNVLAHNPEVIRMVEREDGKEPGFLAYLPLNDAGYHALQDGIFQRRNPDLESSDAGRRTDFGTLHLVCLFARKFHSGHFRHCGAF